MAPRHRILFLDAYDSFSNNITAQLATLLDADVFVLPIDAPGLATAAALRRELAHYDAVVCGPGPGSPLTPGDVGLQARIWDLAGAGDGELLLLPALGVCLGFQGLLAACGARVRRLRRGLHGMVRPIAHRGLDLDLDLDQQQLADHDGSGAGAGAGADVFSGVGAFRATLYHSLCVDVGQDDVPAAEWDAWRWRAPLACPDVVPLAWAEEARDDDGHDDGGRNDEGEGEGEGESGVGAERILMAARHRTKPFWGLQYHPESVCTEPEANRVVVNWFGEALRWNAARGRTVIRDGGGGGGGMMARNATTPSLLSGIRIGLSPGVGREKGWWESFGVDGDFYSTTLSLPEKIQVPDIVEALEPVDGAERIVLESSNAVSANAKIDERCRYSIIALDVQDALKVEYRSGKDSVTIKQGQSEGMPSGVSCEVPLGEYGGIWGFLAGFQQARSKPAAVAAAARFESPFLGGFMGYLTYEQGLHGIGIPLPQNRGHSRPDVCLAWVTKSIIIDHATGVLHIQHLRHSEADTWVKQTAAKLLSSWENVSYHDPLSPSVRNKEDQTGANNILRPIKPRRFSRSIPRVHAPGTVEYEEKVKTCQDFIAAGESYELCLTDQTRILRPRSDPIANSTITTTTNTTTNTTTANTAPSQPRMRRRSSASAPGSWSMFKTLRSRQPAPFASYVRLGGATLVSASPERFLCYDRTGLCSMRPMKGTVRKSAAVATLAQARALLRVPKEEAENLMIVDLVRHDLHGICGAGRVAVPHLLRVEEYQSIFTMITVVEGRLPGPNFDSESDSASGSDAGWGGYTGYTGFDVLAASLPPGSMTGAPKKRSCEILQRIEQGKERSLYSGVVGYMCVSGAGDWSVTIRAMFRWDDEQADDVADGGSEPHEVWRIGAGGAVTILSTAEGEREEMFTKLAGPLGVFTDAI